jgi:hypothetical protein
VIAIRNPHAVARLARSMIQRVPRGATPSRTITAPEPCESADLLSETERLAQFERSRNFRTPTADSSEPSPESALPCAVGESATYSPSERSVTPCPTSTP